MNILWIGCVPHIIGQRELANADKNALHYKIIYVGLHMLYITNHQALAKEALLSVL